MEKYRAKQIVLCLVFVLLSSVCFSQKEFDAKEFFIEAESYFLFEEYGDALPLYQRILRVEPENYNVMYKIGVCYLNDPYQKNRSVKFLLDASEHISPKFKNNNFKEKNAPVDVLYYLGMAYRVNNSLNKAIESYNKFKNTVDPEVYNLDVVNAELASCESAKRAMRRPVFSKFANMGEGVNSRFAEVNPVFSGDGKTIVFTRKMQFYDAVFISTIKSDGTWSAPYNLTPEFGLDGNSYSTGVSFNGDEVYVYRSDNFDGNIYSSKKTDGKWSTLVKLNDNINTKYWESHASISADGQHLYFTSNRKGGYGGLDIYRSTRTAKGDWGPAVNLGPAVNSVYNEETPFISPRDNKLYFSSLGHGSIGGYDIYISERTSASKWSKPVNMGYPFNTTDDDLFFCPVDIADITGVRSGYVEENTYGLKDIYWLEVYNEILPRNYTVSGQVNVPNKEILSSGALKVSLINNKQGKIVSQSVVDSSGSFDLSATQGEYQLLVDGEGIKPVSVPVTLSLNQDNSNIELALITAMAAAVGEDVMLVAPSKLPELEIVGEEYIVADTTPLTIELLVEKGTELKIETYAGATKVNEEEYHITKGKFAYILDPLPGENKVLFTLTDSRGNKSTREVIVYYTPQAEPITEQKIEPVIKETAVLGTAALAGAGLSGYLLTLGDVNFDTKAELYSTLIANADSNGYSKEDVDEFFALILTQRDKDEFIEAVNQTPEFDESRLADSLLELIDYPLAIVFETKSAYSASDSEINEGLVSIVPIDANAENELLYILSFVNADEGETYSVLSDQVSYVDVLGAANNKNTADSAVNLASTTQLLDFFYHNLLVKAEGSLHNMLIDVDFEAENIDNSIELTKHLLNTASDYGISSEELILHIERANVAQSSNLMLFQEALAISATGNLKTYVESLDLEDAGIETYEELVAHLLSNAKANGYTTQQVYELLVEMLGFENSNELAAALLAKSESTDIDSLLQGAENQQFSTQLELIQYLLAQSANFDYTDSDINNLLLRLLLERGIESYSQAEALQQAERLMKRKKAVTVIVLANALITLLIIIFWRRRKKKQ